MVAMKSESQDSFPIIFRLPQRVIALLMRPIRTGLLPSYVFPSSHLRWLGSVEPGFSACASDMSSWAEPARGQCLGAGESDQLFHASISHSLTALKCSARDSRRFLAILPPFAFPMEVIRRYPLDVAPTVSSQLSDKCTLYFGQHSALELVPDILISLAFRLQSCWHSSMVVENSNSGQRAAEKKNLP